MRLLLLLLSVISGPAFADSPASRCPDLRIAMLYAAQHTNYPMPQTCPDIIFTTSSDKARGNVADTLIYLRQGVGFYPDTGAILLPTSLDLRTPEGTAKVLHQIVRAYQHTHQANLTAACPAALIGQAYRIEGQFLRDNGLEKAAENAFRMGVFRGRCPAEPKLN